jgi:hypothetical protein
MPIDHGRARAMIRSAWSMSNAFKSFCFRSLICAPVRLFVTFSPPSPCWARALTLADLGLVVLEQHRRRRALQMNVNVFVLENRDLDRHDHAVQVLV